MSRCKQCDDEIAWAKSATSGKWIPLDIDPVSYGHGMILGESLFAVFDGVAHYARPFSSAGGLRYFKMHMTTCSAIDREPQVNPAPPITGGALWYGLAHMLQQFSAVSLTRPAGSWPEDERAIECALEAWAS